MAELAGSVSDLGGVAGQIRVEGNRHYIFCYVQASASAGQPLVLSYDGDEETNPKTITPATNATVKALVVFPPTAQGATAGFQFCQFRGDAEVLVDGTTDVAKDDLLEVIDAGTGLIKDGTAKTVQSVAIAQEAQATNANTLTNVYLLGELVNVQAS